MALLLLCYQLAACASDTGKNSRVHSFITQLRVEGRLCARIILFTWFLSASYSLKPGTAHSACALDPVLSLLSPVKVIHSLSQASLKFLLLTRDLETCQ